MVNHLSTRQKLQEKQKRPVQPRNQQDSNQKHLGLVSTSKSRNYYFHSNILVI